MHPAGHEIIVNRGPQLVQFIKGYRYRRSPGVSISRRQSSQIQISGEISVLRNASRLLDRISKFSNLPHSRPYSVSIFSITASPGARDGISETKRSRTSRSPSSSSSTPEDVFLINPFRSCSRTSLWIKGRNPTPCTIPCILIRALSIFRPAFRMENCHLHRRPPVKGTDKTILPYILLYYSPLLYILQVLTFNSQFFCTGHWQISHIC